MMVIIVWLQQWTSLGTGDNSKICKEVNKFGNPSGSKIAQEMNLKLIWIPPIVLKKMSKCLNRALWQPPSHTSKDMLQLAELMLLHWRFQNLIVGPILLWGIKPIVQLVRIEGVKDLSRVEKIQREIQWTKFQMISRLANLNIIENSKTRSNMPLSPWKRLNKLIIRPGDRTTTRISAPKMRQVILTCLAESTLKHQ